MSAADSPFRDRPRARARHLTVGTSILKILPRRLRRRVVPCLVLACGLAASLCGSAAHAAAPLPADPARIAWTSGSAAERSVDLPSNWSERLRGAVQDKLVPIVESFTDLLRPAGGTLTWGGPVHFNNAGSAIATRGPDFARAFTAEEPTATAPNDDSFSPLMLNPRRFRVPWLVAPSNFFHAMPVIPVASLGAIRLDLVAATLGTNSGTSAASVQVAVRF